MTSDSVNLAVQYINTTDHHIFLTGKAGTGKTTFLASLGQRTYKRFAIVAPTGIAALNAGGVTIHSLFQLPFGAFVPQEFAFNDYDGNTAIYNRQSLSKGQPLQQMRREVLRALELLIIDEVSMVRADLLDAIDYRLRSVKGVFNRSFGGVQVLMIGDLFQLPPIVMDSEWSYLQPYYRSIHFFESRALRDSGFVTIELQQVFRQSNPQFIQLLNHLRSNSITAADVELLNSHYRSEQEIRKLTDSLTITTHNAKANAINERHLQNLQGTVYTYWADLAGDFNEKNYPLSAKLELKVGAQVMIIKNDPSGSGSYYNGKLAKVVQLETDRIVVDFNDGIKGYELNRHQWENVRYRIGSTTKELEKEVIGTFSHYPIKLAWAITVHKSQGLTFERAIIDVEEAFAPGQVYVALSRLKSLDGLVLRSKIDPRSIINDRVIVDFSNQTEELDSLQHRLHDVQNKYALELLSKAFDFSPLFESFNNLTMTARKKSKAGINDKYLDLESMQKSLIAEIDKTKKFTEELIDLFKERSWEILKVQLTNKGIYYHKLLIAMNQKIELAMKAMQSNVESSKIQVKRIEEVGLRCRATKKAIVYCVNVVISIVEHELQSGASMSKKLLK